MARVEVQGFDELDATFKRLEAKSTEMAKTAVNRAAPKVREALKREIRNKTNRGYSTGDLEESIRASEAKENAYGVFAVVGPVGENRRGESNAKIMAMLEYGVRSHHQAPVAIRQPAVASVEQDVINIVRQVIEEGVGS